VRVDPEPVEAPVHPSLLERRILHVDMDAFYASIEMRDDPALRGRPVVVGGDPYGRGVVATASYEARAFGVRSAMPAAQARRLCPAAVFVRPRFGVYKAASQRVRAVFSRYTDRVEPMSLDEAYLDVTAAAQRGAAGSATALASRIKREIFEETGLTASAGVAPNKMVAKIASDMHKPDGLTVVRPAQVRSFMEPLAVRRIPGIGRVTGHRLAELGIVTCRDVAELGRRALVTRLGRRLGRWLHDRARGLDPRPVVSERAAKSVGHEDTFREDVARLPHMDELLVGMAARVAERLQRAGVRGRTVVLKARYPDFTTVTRTRSLPGFTDDPDRIARVATELLRLTEAAERAVRLLGVTVANLDSDAGTNDDPRQLWLPGLQPHA
jgi:DNA polymerase-4